MSRPVRDHPVAILLEAVGTRRYCGETIDRGDHASMPGSSGVPGRRGIGRTAFSSHDSQVVGHIGHIDVIEKLAEGVLEEPLLIGVGPGHAIVDPEAIAPVLEDTGIQQVA